MPLPVSFDKSQQTKTPTVGLPENVEDRFVAMINERKYRNQEVQYSDTQV
jgi:hypothetical protein